MVFETGRDVSIDIFFFESTYFIQAKKKIEGVLAPDDDGMNRVFM
jgi:hypothetical protein